MTDYIVNALRVEVGVNMGDHGQDVTTAIDVRPDDTIGSVIERHLMKSWPKDQPDPNKRVEIRIALDRDSEQVA